MVKKQFTKTIKIFQFDGDGEFNSTAFVEHLDKCAKLPQFLWIKAFLTAVFPINIMPSSVLQKGTSSSDVDSSNLRKVLNGSPLSDKGDQPTVDVNAPPPSDQSTPDAPIDAPADAPDENVKPTPTTDHNVEPAESPVAVVPKGTGDHMTTTTPSLPWITTDAPTEPQSTGSSEESNNSAQDSAPSHSNVFSVYDP
ncbi:hypothetical protein A4A49_63161 [Nicotiana attenuata]|uniref:Uncharacterized protein n=1 Tax=Nicotiana attenuata TaxID=49451 RepID=A0A1J6ISR3_NICAT|nr:hypothetical protein A4A49_63161 [Nicotiana attenuata]